MPRVKTLGVFFRVSSLGVGGGGLARCFHKHPHADHRVSGSLIARRIATPRGSRRNGSSSGSFTKL